jgi:hypothetical protein
MNDNILRALIIVFGGGIIAIGGILIFTLLSFLHNAILTLMKDDDN